jgi:hypothetical protein
MKAARCANDLTTGGLNVAFVAFSLKYIKEIQCVFPWRRYLGGFTFKHALAV